MNPALIIAYKSTKLSAINVISNEINTKMFHSNIELTK